MNPQATHLTRDQSPFHYGENIDITTSLPCLHDCGRFLVNHSNAINFQLTTVRGADQVTAPKQASHESSSVDVQGALVVLDALEELREVALAEAAAAASLL